jgi:hypothetical protein
MQMAVLGDLLEQGPIAINLGLQDFAKALQDQGGDVIHVDWSPRPEIEEELKGILDELL